MAKTKFPCGHVGKGTYCHRCIQEKQKKDNEVFANQEKGEWEQLFAHDPVNLRILQKKSLIEKARQIIKSISRGEPYITFKGKRMNFDRTVISVPINRDYRLIYYDTGAELVLRDLLSHEKYNVKKPGEKI